MALRAAREAGLKIWSGFLVGLGETEEDIARGFGLLSEFEPDSLSILAFTPYPSTDMAFEDCANPSRWARWMASARLLFPKANVFSDFTDGFYGAFAEHAGANGFYVFPAMDGHP